jgi:hypothetical protein
MGDENTYSQTVEGRVFAVGMAAMLTNLSIPFQMTLETESVCGREHLIEYTIYTFTVNHKFQPQLDRLIQD